MRKPSLTFDTFFTALAVLGATASVGCSKGAPAGSAAPEPPAAAAAPASPPPALPGEPPAAQAPAPLAAPAPAPADEAKSPPAARATAAPVPSPVSATAVDAGKAGSAKDGVKKPADTKGQMSCGAGGCSPDMKKGSGN